MLKNITRIECQIATRTFYLCCDQDSPLGDVKEAIFQFQKMVGQIEDRHKEAAEKSAKEQAEKEQIQPEVDIQSE